MHMLKVKLSAAKGMFTYDGREPGDYVNPETHGETLHPEMTASNYALVYGTTRNGNPGIVSTKPHRAARRCAAALDDARSRHVGTTGREPRKDAVGVAQWCVTLPAGVPQERASEFFGRMLLFLRKRYGAENVPAGFVHMDESTPHMHVPVLMMRDGRFQAKNIVNRRDLSTMHDDAESAMSKHGLGGLLLSDDDVLGKALSKLDRSEMNAVKEYIKRSVDAQTVSERSKLQERASALDDWEQALTARQGAFEGQVLNAEALSDWSISAERTAIRDRDLQAKIDRAAAFGRGGQRGGHDLELQ